MSGGLVVARRGGDHDDCRARWRLSCGAGAWVHAWRQSVVSGELAEEAAELGPPPIVEGAEEVFAVIVGDPTDVAQSILAGGCEVQCVVASDSNVASSFEQPFALELVDEGDESAREQTELFGHGVLRSSLIGGDGSQQTGVGRLEPDGLETFGETGRGERSHLGDQES